MSSTRPWRYCPSCGTVLDINGSVTDPQAAQVAQVCSACGLARYANPTPVAAALVETPEGIVLVHNRDWPAKVFGLVTGFVETGESPDDTARREVKEELGLDARLDHLIGFYPLRETNQLVVAYALTASGDITLTDEIDDFRIVPREKLRSWSFGTGPAVRDWLALHSAAPKHRQPIMDVLEVLGRRWTLRILWELSERGPLGFRALREACDDLSPDTLSTRLKDLSAADLVTNESTRTDQDTSNNWRLTARALKLKPHLFGVAQWARGK